ncbi:MAG: MotA/TolQ/ExbB proton channel family protein [Myxococcota bacterium]
MTLYHAGQLVLAVVAVAVIASRIRVLLYDAPLPLRPFRRLLTAAVRDGDMERARAMAAAAEPAWVGQAARTALEAHGEGHEAWLSAEPLLLELRFEAERGLWGLRALASLASALGFLGAIWELLKMLQGDHGLEGLMAGLAERMAFERALLSLLLGAVVAGVCLYARAILGRQAVRLLRDVRDLLDSLLEALGVKHTSEAP